MRYFLRKLFPPRLPKPRRKYVGFVHGLSVFTQNEKEFEQHGYWILTEYMGERKAEEVGDAGTSPLAVSKAAQVRGWLSGGPMPVLGNHARTPSPPKPRKSAPKKADLKVVEFKPRSVA